MAKQRKDDDFDSNPLAQGGADFKPTAPEDQPTMSQVEEALRDSTDATADQPVASEPAPAPVSTGMDPNAVMGMLQTLTAAVTTLAEMQAKGQASPNSDALMTKLTEAMDRIAANTLQGAEIQAMEAKRAHRPSNEIYHGKSVFDRRGTMLADYKKPALKCIMMLPFLAEWEGLTREEVQLLNLLDAGSYVVKRIDNSKVKLDIVVSYALDNKTPSRLVVRHDTAFNNDNFSLWPPITEWVRQVLRQHENKEVYRAALGVLSDEEEEALIEAGELSVSV